jgi:hypothetical protein
MRRAPMQYLKRILIGAGAVVLFTCFNLVATIGRGKNLHALTSITLTSGTYVTASPIITFATPPGGLDPAIYRSFYWSWRVDNCSTHRWWICALSNKAYNKGTTRATSHSTSTGTRNPEAPTGTPRASNSKKA